MFHRKFLLKSGLCKSAPSNCKRRSYNASSESADTSSLANRLWLSEICTLPESWLLRVVTYIACNNILTENGKHSNKFSGCFNGFLFFSSIEELRSFSFRNLSKSITFPILQINTVKRINLETTPSPLCHSSTGWESPDNSFAIRDWVLGGVVLQTSPIIPIFGEDHKLPFLSCVETPRWGVSAGMGKCLRCACDDETHAMRLYGDGAFLAENHPTLAAASSAPLLGRGIRDGKRRGRFCLRGGRDRDGRCRRFASPKKVSPLCSGILLRGAFRGRW